MWDEGLVSGPDRLCAAGAAQEAGTSLRGSDPCAPDPVETKSFVGALRVSERASEREKERGGRWKGGRLSRFIARSREASTEHSFNQTVTSPPGAAQRLENRSLLGALPCLRFCSHAPRLSSERSAGSNGTFFFIRA